MHFQLSGLADLRKDNHAHREPVTTWVTSRRPPSRRAEVLFPPGTFNEPKLAVDFSPTIQICAHSR
jgi:hypothetical protein